MGDVPRTAQTTRRIGDPPAGPRATCVTGVCGRDRPPPHPPSTPASSDSRIPQRPTALAPPTPACAPPASNGARAHSLACSRPPAAALSSLAGGGAACSHRTSPNDSYVISSSADWRGTLGSPTRRSRRHQRITLPHPATGAHRPTALAARTHITSHPSRLGWRGGLRRATTLPAGSAFTPAAPHANHEGHRRYGGRRGHGRAPPRPGRRAARRRRPRPLGVPGAPQRQHRHQGTPCRT